jgi:hypothetical protein
LFTKCSLDFTISSILSLKLDIFASFLSFSFVLWFPSGFHCCSLPQAHIHIIVQLNKSPPRRWCPLFSNFLLSLCSRNM